MTTAVGGSLRWVMTPVGRALRASALEGLAHHLFTSRDATFRGERAEGDYRQLGASFDLPPGLVSFVSQVHGRTVRVIHPGDTAEAGEADAIISTDPARAIGVRVADCVPILIADTRRRVVGAVHAGWRGTAAGIAAAAVGAIARLGPDPADLVAVIGPSIGPCCYQVDGPVYRAFAGAPDEGADISAGQARTSWFTEDGPGRWRLDLWRANIEQLRAAGVPAPAIHAARYCTADHLDRCFSYRAEGPGTGRMIAAIRLAPRDNGSSRVTV